MNRILRSIPQNITATEMRFMKKMLAEIINNEGFYFRNLGNIPIALKFYHQSLKLLEELQDSVGMGFIPLLSSN